MALTGLTNLQPLHVHSIGISTFDGSVSVGGTLTYEDVTNVDSIGIITARSGINISDTTQSSSTTTGALKVAGGVGVVKNLQVGGSITGVGSMVVSSNATFTASGGYSVIANGSSTGIGLGSNGIIVFGSQNIAAYGPGVLDGTQYQFKTSGNERVRITPTGELFIGVAANTGGNGDTDDIIVSGTGKKGITICSTDGSETRLTFADGLSGTNAVVGQVLYDHSSNRMDFYTSTNRRASIDSSGRVLIGTLTEGNSSADNLTIADSGESGITVRSGTSNGGHIYFSDATSGTAEYQGGLSYQHGGDFMKFITNATERLRINTGGSIGVSHDLSGTSNYNRLMLHNPHDGSCWLQMTSTASGNTANTDGLSIGLNSSNQGHVWLRENAKMMLATNGTSRMEISASGIVTKPYQVAWAMHGTGTQNVTGGTRLNFNINGSGFGNFSNRNHGGVNTTNNSFTVPVTGLYCIILTVFCYTNNNTNTFSFVPYKNGTAMHNGNDTIFVFGASAVNANITYSGSILLQLNANDEIDIRRRSGEAGTSVIYLAHSHFSGFLVG